MKPRTKLQVKVDSLSRSLPKLANDLEAWAFKNCIDHIGYRNKMWTSCLSCGHVWPTTSMRIKSEVCHGCGWKLKLTTTRKQKSRDWARFAVFSVVEDFQVVRYFDINCHMKAKEKASCYTREIMQHWLLPNGQFEIMSSQVGGLGLAYDHFGYGEISIKNKRDLWKYNIPVFKIFPRMELMPVFKRNGLVPGLTQIKPFDLLKKLPTDAKTETLLKAKQFSLLKEHLGDRGSRTWHHWPSVKICIRQGYIIKDAITWLDYLELLHFFSKDLHNAKYVCPSNLKKEHDRLVKKKDQITKRQDLLRLMKQAENDQKEYAKAKSVFFGLAFIDKNLEIKVLEHVKEFIEESEVHKHCVYSNRYFKREDSLVFSARINGKSVETVEVSLSSMEIVQSRGLYNRASPYNDQIKDLLTKNMHIIRKRLEARKEAA